jgi:hypothetical protein
MGIIARIEWQAPAMGPDDARRLADDATEMFSHVPGLVEIRFFGDFETGRHFYFQRWESEAALDAFMASESMFRNREIAAPFVSGRPTRVIYADYSPEAK